VAGVVWAVTQFAAGDLWWAGDDISDSGGIIDPPDADASGTWYAGGSDGTYIYQGAVDESASNQWWVDKFDAGMTTLLDRWEVTGWTAAFAADWWNPITAVQMVCADGSRVVVIADHLDGSSSHVSIDVSVFDLSGALLDQWAYATPDLDAFGSRYSLAVTGSCTDGSFVYFWMNNPVDANNIMVKVELSTGTLTQLFTNDDANAQIDPDADVSQGGVVEKDGDLIIASSSWVARLQQDGTLVWATEVPVPDVGVNLQAIAHSGSGSVWVVSDPGSSFSTQAEEYLYDGTYVRTVDIPETVEYAWLVAAAAATKWFVGRVGWTP
jgi:hypothetical protein